MTNWELYVYLQHTYLLIVLLKTTTAVLSSGGVFKCTDLTMQDIRTFLKDFESKFKVDQYN